MADDPVTPLQRARAVARGQNAEPLSRYRHAQVVQRDQALIATGRPVPARITVALDLCGLYGPDVDEACNAQEPDVDRWEAGLDVPTAEQVELLAELTGYPVAHFYRPVKPGPLLEGMWICYRGRRGCERPIPDVITDAGVLLYEGKPRIVAATAQASLFPAGPARQTKPRPRARTPKAPAPQPAPAALPIAVDGPSGQARAELAAAIARGKQRWQR